MSFLKPNKLTLSIFSLPFLLLCSPLVGNLVGIYNLPGFLGSIVFFFYYFSITPFAIFNVLGIHLLGGYGDGFAFFEPNGFFGWVIILLIWAIITILLRA